LKKDSSWTLADNVSVNVQYFDSRFEKKPEQLLMNHNEKNYNKERRNKIEMIPFK
jgi:hypothetical protein